MSKNLYIVSSGIRTKTIKEDNSIERYHQTLHTISSIRSRDKDADIVILETGTIPVEPWMKEELEAYAEFIDLTKHPRVKGIQSEAEQLASVIWNRVDDKEGRDEAETKLRIKSAYLKSCTESWSIQYLFEQRDLSSYDKIFKLSGRYFLTSKFNLSNFDSMVTFKKQERMSNDKEFTVSSVLWSFKGEYFEEFKKCWNNTINYFTLKWTKFQIWDLESSISTGFNLKSNPVEVKFAKELGVMGAVNAPEYKNVNWSQ